MATKYDWEAIEADYSAGVKSIRSIAGEHDVTEGGIRKRAKRFGWQRDLSTSVRSAVKSKLVRGEGTQSDMRTDADIVDSASSEMAQVVIGHRTLISRWSSISTRLADTLNLIQVDEENHNEFARSLNSGVDALGKCIKLERQAFNMDEESPDHSPERVLADDDLDARIAALTKQAGNGQ